MVNSCLLYMQTRSRLTPEQRKYFLFGFLSVLTSIAVLKLRDISNGSKTLTFGTKLPALSVFHWKCLVELKKGHFSKHLRSSSRALFEHLLEAWGRFRNLGLISKETETSKENGIFITSLWELSARCWIRFYQNIFMP